MDYLGSLTNSIFSLVFIIFLIGTVGYFIGAISIRGISLGTAGVLLTALLYGIIAHFVPSFSIGGTEIVLFSERRKAPY